MFIHYMYVDILFPLTKAIPVMLEHVTKHYQTLQTWRGHNAMRYHNFNALPHALPHAHMRYRTFSLNLKWIGHNAMCYHNFNVLSHMLPYILFSLARSGTICNSLPRVTVKFIKKNIY